MKVRVHSSWEARLRNYFQTESFRNLAEFIKSEYKSKTVYPPAKWIFRALDEVPFDQVRAVILGQDPYHGPGQANGLCFSVHPGIPIPPSLSNIYKEIVREFGGSFPKSGDLSGWARQGVLLLNATLTVLEGAAGSHQKKGWEEFTDEVVRVLAEEKQGLVFLLWGSYAKKKGESIPPGKHLILHSAHPSPLSAHRGFLGNDHFRKTNEYLKEKGQKPIDWLGSLT